MSFFNLDNKNDFVMLIIGKRNRGKTYKAIQLLISDNGLKELFDEILIICPTIHFNNEWSILGDIEDKNIFDKFSQETIEVLDTYFQQQYKKNPQKHHLLLLDDCLGSQSFSKRTDETPLSKLVALGRNYNVSVIILSQKFRGVPFNVRNNADYYILFKTTNHKEFEAIENEVSVGSKQQWRDIWKECFKKPHDWLMIKDRDDSVYINGKQINLDKKCPKGQSICFCNL